MAIRIKCPICAKKFQVKAELAIMRTKCPECGNCFEVPEMSPILWPVNIAKSFSAGIARWMAALSGKDKAHLQTTDKKLPEALRREDGKIAAISKKQSKSTEDDDEQAIFQDPSWLVKPATPPQSAEDAEPAPVAALFSRQPEPRPSTNFQELTTGDAHLAASVLCEKACLTVPDVTTIDVYQSFLDLASAWGSKEVYEGTTTAVERAVGNYLSRVKREPGFLDFTVKTYPNHRCAQVEVFFQQYFYPVRVWRRAGMFVVCGNSTFDGGGLISLVFETKLSGEDVQETLETPAGTVTVATLALLALWRIMTFGRGGGVRCPSYDTLARILSRDGLQLAAEQTHSLVRELAAHGFLEHEGNDQDFTVRPTKAGLECLDRWTPPIAARHR